MASGLSYLATALAALACIATTAAQAVPAPAPTQPKTTTACTRWHVVQTGNTCPILESLYKITRTQFRTWNPAVNSDCTANFWVGNAYCVSVTAGVPPAPTHTGTTTACKRWHVVQSGNTCPILEAMYGITRAQFRTWNPAVSADCVTNFWAGYAYCVSITAQKTTTTSSTKPATAKPVSTGPPGPTFTDTPNNCNGWHLVVAPNTGGCDAVASRYGITRAQFVAMNPSISADCSEGYWIGYAYCVRLGPPVTTTSTSSTKPATAKPVSTGPPGPTFTDTPNNCNGWHLVVAPNTGGCDAVASRYGITRAQFVAMNPSISADCSEGYWIGYAYCVRLGPPVTTTSSSSLTTSRPASSSTYFNSTYSIQHPTTSWAITTPTRANSTWPPTQTQAGQPAFCNSWHLVSPGEKCRAIIVRYAAVNYMSTDDFFAWNPAVNEDCSGLYINYWVCVGIELQEGLTVEFPDPANGIETGNSTTSRPPLVIPTPPPEIEIDTSFDPTPFHGTPPTNCRQYYKARADDSCTTILADNPDITRAQFFSWNSALNGDCQGLWTGYYYCINAFAQDPDMPPVITVLPEPVHPGTASNCMAWHKATDGDECWMFSYMFGTFSDAEFLAMNPSIAGLDCEGFEVDYWYCVAVPGTPTTRTAAPTSPFTATETAASTITSPVTTSTSKSGFSSSRPASTTTSAVAVSTPQPIQAPIIAGCRRFYYVQSGDGCWQISNDAGISIDDFYLYNPAAAPDCSSMWGSIFVCVGISGPVATFSGTPPLPAPTS